MWYAGIDWAKNHHDVAVIDDQGRQVASRLVAHTPAGLTQLTAFLLEITATPEQMACIIDRSQLFCANHWLSFPPRA